MLSKLRIAMELGAAALLVCLAGWTWAQTDGGFSFTGSYEDVKQLPPQTWQKHEFTFVRLIYNGSIPGYLKNWYTDYPTGDRELVDVVRRLTRIDIAPETRAIAITDPDLFNYPFVYSGEAGQMNLSTRDAEILREYIDRGGFWMLDDFWGSIEWAHFEAEMKKVFPDRQIKEVSPTHPIFHIFFNIEQLVQVPNVGWAYGSCYPGCPTSELDGDVPFMRGIFDENGRLLVVINHNTDLMDALEWSNEPRYAEGFAAYAYKVFINTILYALTAGNKTLDTSRKISSTFPISLRPPDGISGGFLIHKISLPHVTRPPAMRWLCFLEAGLCQRKTQVGSHIGCHYDKKSQVDQHRSGVALRSVDCHMQLINDLNQL